MPLPTMSLRAAPEHHQLIRDIATALRTRPELADALRDVLQSKHGIAPRNTDVLQSILDRLDALEKRASMPVTLQTRSESPAPRPHTPRPPRPVAGGLTAISDEHSEEAYLCQIAGMTIAEAIELKGWTWKEHELAAAVERWREKHHVQEMLLLEQHRQVAAMLKAGKAAKEIKAWLDLQKAEQPDTARHVAENPAAPVEPPIGPEPASETGPGLPAP
jgi:hypothetical protein